MKTSSLLARAAAATATLAAGIAGTLVVAQPAQAALVETDYGFSAFAFVLFDAPPPNPHTLAPPSILRFCREPSANAPRL